MNANPTTNTPADEWGPDELGERISAYLDGELTPAESALVERRLADDPAAARLAEGLRSVSDACRQAPAVSFPNDLSATVVAEALRRQATADHEPVARLEPEGDFGLPFGKSSRTWAWAGVAIAAAVLIGFYGRPTPPSSRGPQPGSAAVAQSLRSMQQAVPGMQVVNFQATPDMLNRLRQRLALQSAQRAQLPGELMAVSEAIDPSPSSDSGEQLLYVDAEEAELDRLLNELSEEEGSLVRVAADPGATPQPAQTAPAPTNPRPGIRAVPLRVKLSQEDLAKLIVQQQQKQSAAAPGQRRIVVLRIQVKPRP